MKTLEPNSHPRIGILLRAALARSRFPILAGAAAAALTLLFSTPSRAADASLDVGAFGVDSTSRTLPAVLHTAVDVGTFTFSGHTGSLAISVNVGSSSYWVAKRFVIPMRYNLAGISVANTWLKVLPAHDTGPYGGNDFDLDIKVTQGVMNVRLRVAATDTAHPGAAGIVIESTGVSAITFSTASSVVTPPAANRVFAGNVLTQIAGRAGVNILPSADAALDINGGDTKGLRLRPRTTAGAPATGAWNKGTLIVDATGTLYVCTADGIPGTWKKVGAP